MITIVEPKEHIDKLWGKQRIRDGDTYRMMRYVLRVNHDDKVLLHNVVTGQLVVLEQKEATTVDKLPLRYDPVMETLVTEHYLVPEGYDEHKQVVNLRSILRSLDEAQKPRGVITHYTILPTTACNARCYYCFEQGCETVTMTEETADNVVNYIASHCGETKWVQLSWFGGEPTVAAHRINQICEGLQRQGISYQSDLTTNGYLLDEVMVEKAVNLWKLKSCMICVDGTENTYNSVKAYVAAIGSPYETVMRNISSLLDHGVHVNLRMNFDIDNCAEFADLVKDVVERFSGESLLQVYAHPIFGEHVNPEGKLSHATNDWFSQKVVELNNLAREAGLLASRNELPSIEFKACQAYSEASAGINPRGSLIRCPEQFGELEATGNVIEGTTNPEKLRSWKHYADLEMCRKCSLLPICQRNERCMARDTCCYYAEYINLFRTVMVTASESVKIKRGGNAK